MKRSQVNLLIREALDFFEQFKFRLPPWATWQPQQWKGRGQEATDIVTNHLGWDLTDFGQGRFHERGLLLFTIRNGPARGEGKPYAEKIMVVREQQETPLHFHWRKMEDIINRGGGNLVLELFHSTADGQLGSDPVVARVDGIERRVDPGERVVLGPGESICLVPGVYHRFYGEQGQGTVLVGEVSSVNDDAADNRFHEDLGRFPEIEEELVAPHRGFWRP